MSIGIPSREKSREGVFALHRDGLSYLFMMHPLLLQFFCLCLSMSLCGLSYATSADSIELIRPQTTFHAHTHEKFAKVVDGIAAGPDGWSVAGKSQTPQILVVACARPLDAAEIDMTLFFLAGRPFNYLAEFQLSFTTDATPTLQSRWQPLQILRYSSEATILQRMSASGLRASRLPYNVNGTVPDETYRLTAAIPSKRATGFRLIALPVVVHEKESRFGLSYYEPFDFTLTEFRVAIHRRETTNIALHCPARASHPLYQNADRTKMRAESLTDGLPATIAHPGRLREHERFFFEIDLGQSLEIDHIGLRNRGDDQFHRLSRIKLELYESNINELSIPAWQGIVRADGSHPPPGALEIVRPDQGQGRFHGRYLRISSHAEEDYTPQLAEVEVYPKTTPQVMSILADGQALTADKELEIPPGMQRISLKLEIPHTAPTNSSLYRWRLRGQSDKWIHSRQRVIDFSCPQAHRTIFEAQVLHTDGEWDHSIYQLPIIVHEHWWKNTWLRIAMMALALMIAIFIGGLWSRYQTARQVAAIRAEAALADERARIARDMHDDVGGKLARLAILGDLALHQQSQASPLSTEPISAMTHGIREVASELEQVIWSLKPNHDCLHSLARRIYQYSEEFFSGTPIHCSFGSMQQIPDNVSLSPDARNALFRSSKEALANVLKHSHASKVDIDITWRDQQCFICIQDNGSGFVVDQIEQISHHNGIANMRQRLGSVGGSCRIESSAEGTRICLGWSPT